jgi:hypothetical protein
MGSYHAVVTTGIHHTAFTKFKKASWSAFKTISVVLVKINMNTNVASKVHRDENRKITNNVLLSTCLLRLATFSTRLQTRETRGRADSTSAIMAMSNPTVWKCTTKKFENTAMLVDSTVL